MQNTAYKFAPLSSGEKRVDLAIKDGEAIIQLSTWEDGLGWCTQKTMRFDAEMLDELHRMVAAARIRLREDDDDALLPATVLEFPSVRGSLHNRN